MTRLLPTPQVSALIGLALLSTSACGRKKPPPPPPPPEVGFVVVRTEPVTLTSELPGRVTAFATADVRPQVSGIIRSRLFTEGVDVRAGQALYQIDPAPYEAAVAQAQAQLASAQATVAAQRLQAERYADLVKINAVSRQENDNAQASFGQARANVEQFQAALRSARINLGFTRVKAPIAGRIGRSLVTIGALTQSGQTDPLATIQALDPIYVDVTQSADDLLKLRRAVSTGGLDNAGAQRARVTLLLSDGSRYAHQGELRFSEAQVDTATGSVTLRAVFPNPARTLLPGMFVRETLADAVDENGILVPQPAVSRNEKGEATAMVVGAGDKAEPRVLVTSRAVGDRWLVTSGLKPGDRLITEGLVKVQQPGVVVRPRPAGSRPSPPPPGAGQPAGRR